MAYTRQALHEKDNVKEGNAEAESVDEVQSHSAAFERRTMLSNAPWDHYSILTYFCRRFVDFRILPLLALLYAFALIDRVNLGAAYTAGMATDLVICFSRELRSAAYVSSIRT
jgi:hypothetical protein